MHGSTLFNLRVIDRKFVLNIASDHPKIEHSLHLRRKTQESNLIQPLDTRPPEGISMKDYKSFFEVHTVERPISDLASWSQPKVPFSRLVEIYETVVDICFGIDFLTEAIVCPGFYVSAANENTKDYISSYAEEIRLDSFNAIVTQEKLAYGNSIFEKWDGFDLKRLPKSRPFQEA
jgi:hypothetical protein